MSYQYQRNVVVFFFLLIFFIEATTSCAYTCVWGIMDWMDSFFFRRRGLFAILDLRLGRPALDRVRPFPRLPVAAPRHRDSEPGGHRLRRGQPQVTTQTRHSLPPLLPSVPFVSSSLSMLLGGGEGGGKANRVMEWLLFRAYLGSINWRILN